MERRPELPNKSPEAMALHTRLYAHLRPEGKNTASLRVPIKLHLKDGRKIDGEVWHGETVPSPQHVPKSVGFEVCTLPSLDTEHLSTEELEAEMDRRQTLPKSETFVFVDYENIQQMELE